MKMLLVLVFCVGTLFSQTYVVNDVDQISFTAVAKCSEYTSKGQVYFIQKKEDISFFYFNDLEDHGNKILINCEDVWHTIPIGDYGYSPVNREIGIKFSPEGSYGSLPAKIILIDNKTGMIIQDLTPDEIIGQEINKLFYTDGYVYFSVISWEKERGEKFIYSLNINTGETKLIHNGSLLNFIYQCYDQSGVVVIGENKNIIWHYNLNNHPIIYTGKFYLVNKEKKQLQEVDSKFDLHDYKIFNFTRSTRK